MAAQSPGLPTPILSLGVDPSVENGDGIIGKLHRYWRLLFWLTCMLGFTYGVCRNALMLLLPQLTDRFEEGYAAVGVMITAHQVSYLLGSAAIGFLASFVRPEIVIQSSLWVSSLCLVGLGTLNSFDSIALVYTTLGVLIAASWIPVLQLVSSSLPTDDRVFFLSMAASGGSVGFIINGVAVAPLYRWGGFFTVFVVAAVCAVALALWTRQALASLPIAREAKRNAQEGTARDGSAASPTTSIVICCIMACAGFGLVQFQSFFSAALIEDLRMSVESAQSVWIYVGVIGLASGFCVSALADRIGIRPALACIFAALAIALLLLSLTQAPLIAVLAALIYGLLFFGMFGLFPGYLAIVFDANRGARVYGTATVFMGMGSALSGAVGGFVKQETGSFSLLWALCCVSCLIGTLLTLALPKSQT